MSGLSSMKAQHWLPDYPVPLPSVARMMNNCQYKV